MHFLQRQRTPRHIQGISALYGIDHHDLKACIREELEQDEMVMRRRFHDHYWPCSVFQLNFMQLFLCELQADHVMVDFLPEQHIVVRTEDAQAAETLADVNTCYWNEAFMKQPPMRDNILMRELTCA